MEDTIRQIQAAQLLALATSAVALLLALLLLYAFAARVRSRALRYATATVVTLVAFAGYLSGFEWLARKLVFRVAIVESLDFGWVEYYFVPALVLLSALLIAQKFPASRGA